MFVRMEEGGAVVRFVVVFVREYVDRGGGEGSILIGVYLLMIHSSKGCVDRDGYDCRLDEEW